MKTIGVSQKKGDKPFLAARIPASLNASLESHVESTGESKTDTLINALAAYLGWSEDKQLKTSSSDRLSQLEKRVKDIEDALYQPRQTNLLELTPNQPRATKQAITPDNKIDNTPTTTEWLTTKEAYEMYGSGVTYDAFRKTNPEKMLERFGLEADLSRKTPGEHSSQWLRKSR